MPSVKRVKVGPKSRKAEVTSDSDVSSDTVAKQSPVRERIKRLNNENEELKKMIKDKRSEIRRVQKKLEDRLTSQDAKSEKLLAEIELKKKKVNKLKKEVQASEDRLKNRAEEITESTDRECQRLVDAYTGSEKVAAVANQLNKDYEKLGHRLEHTAADWQHTGTQVDFDIDLKKLEATASQIANANRQMSNIEMMMKQVLKLEEKIGINQRVLSDHLNKKALKVKKGEVKSEEDYKVKEEKMSFELPNSWGDIKVKEEPKDMESSDGDDYVDESEADEDDGSD